ncbi:hypothetical protein PORY_001206 [Pneumocystis oryctolagi]|uniref:Uncharacterized protein n=1 Tax=Pneumocystis oryctolagi TaxID=42067 RepID=A0ACB7CF12_9ASCO|nr:hypothetical protein PORY_001206 [Pneumocystis oryctolagi]
MSSFGTGLKKVSATGLYRQLLIHISFFFDPFSKVYVRKSVRLRFEANRKQKNPLRIEKAFQDGHKALVSLKKAIAGDIRVRVWSPWKKKARPLLTSLRTNVPMIPGLPRTKLPVISPPFKALLQSQMPKRVIPLESNTTLDRRRHANLCWKEFSFIYLKIFPPLPLEEIKRLEKLSRGEGLLPFNLHSFRKRCLKPPKSADSHHITLRFQRRLYQRLLMKCPSLLYDSDKGWIVKWSKEALSKNMRANSIHEDMFCEERKEQCN